VGGLSRLNPVDRANRIRDRVARTREDVAAAGDEGTGAGRPLLRI
jgi:hypothetical protein